MTFTEIGRILYTTTDQPERDRALREVADWWLANCAAFGVPLERAHYTAWLIVDGMDRNFRPKEAGQ